MASLRGEKVSRCSFASQPFLMIAVHARVLTVEGEGRVLRRGEVLELTLQALYHSRCASVVRHHLRGGEWMKVRWRNRKRQRERDWKAAQFLPSKQQCRLFSLSLKFNSFSINKFHHDHFVTRKVTPTKGRKEEEKEKERKKDILHLKGLTRARKNGTLCLSFILLQEVQEEIQKMTKGKERVKMMWQSKVLGKKSKS